MTTVLRSTLGRSKTVTVLQIYREHRRQYWRATLFFRMYVIDLLQKQRKTEFETAQKRKQLKGANVWEVLWHYEFTSQNLRRSSECS